MRILAGQFKGRSLLAPTTGGPTRPITGQAKKSLFSILGDRIDESLVLDLFCGTGTLGLEAVSQGASRCCFAEKDRRTLDRLRRNIQSFDVGDICTVWSGNIQTRLKYWLGQLDEPVGIAFVDPPYDLSSRWDWDQAEADIFGPLARVLGADGIVVLRLQASAKAPDTIGALTCHRIKKYGDMVISLMSLNRDGE